MPIKRNGLGKGLDSLIPDKNVKPEAEAKVSVEKLLKNKKRGKYLKEDKLKIIL